VAIALVVSGLVAVAPAAPTFASTRPLTINGQSATLRAKPAPTQTTAAGPLGSLCWPRPTTTANVMTSCDNADSPHNETSVAVNPHNPLNMIGSANDSQNGLQAFFPRAHVTFDGGHSWANFALPFPADCDVPGDPMVAFDADGLAYLSTICEHFDSAGNIFGSAIVTSSKDGGITWAPQTRVATGTPTLFNDHPVMTAWGHGHVIVTWIAYYYTSSAQTQIVTVPMQAAVSSDGGQHFSTPVNISGSAPQCVGLSAPNACDQTSGNSVTVASDGSVYAAFSSTTAYRPDGSTNDGRDYHFAVRLDPKTGALKAGPFLQGLAYDGLATHDFPESVAGRQTLHDSQFRIGMFGNITADPTNSRHLAAVWFDDRSAYLPVSADPYSANTDSDVIVTQSYDGGTTWTTPTAIRAAGDQFFAWAAYDAMGRLRIGYHDRSYDPDNHKYGYTLATEKRAGSLQFNQSQVTTALSDPTKDNRWVTATVDKRFPNANVFLGDYSGIAPIGNTNNVVALWADQRIDSCFGGTCGHGQDTFAAVVLR